MNNPSAFPSPGVVLDATREGKYQQGAYEGMSLRDYFAAAALSTLVLYEVNKEPFPNGNYFDYVALRAYFYADAMLTERNKSG